MRVIAGQARSLRLTYPQGVDIRPTTDAMRETLFASLGERVAGARFADLYAGCGSVGIEALSRGAEQCVFVENDARCVKALEANLANTHLDAAAVVLRGPVEQRWERVVAAYGPFDIVFADPPYALPAFAAFAQRLIAGREGVAQTGLVVVQCHASLATPEVRAPDRVKRFGETQMRFYEVAEG